MSPTVADLDAYEDILDRARLGGASPRAQVGLRGVSLSIASPMGVNCSCGVDDADASSGCRRLRPPG
jgi:hypothetical protein